VEKINNLNEHYLYINNKKHISHKYYFKNNSPSIYNESFTPLILSIFKENKIIIENLTLNGADVNQFGLITGNDSYGFEYLSIYPINCAIKRNKDIVKYLIDHGAKLNNAPLPLMYAIEDNNIEMVDLLIYSGAKVNIIFDYSLMLIIKNGHH